MVDGRVAVSSIVIRLEPKLSRDIFGEGNYFYNCRSGSYEFEVNSKGVFEIVLMV